MCSQCEVLYINGIKSHEFGCPISWKDYARACKWCGTEFMPEERYQNFCGDDCSQSYNT